jgi:23S rRNA (uracil1939-C5)-methyltransferase
MTSYQQIKDHIQENHGKKIKSVWIAHAKEIYGIPIKQAGNRKGERRWPCPKKNLPLIKEAFEHFKMI